MQTISGSVGFSLPVNGTADNTEISSEDSVDMASGLGFMALFTTQINSATAADLVTTDLEIEAELQELNGNIIPQTLPLSAMLAKQNLDPEKIISGQDLSGETGSGNGLSKLFGLGDGVLDVKFLEEKLASSLGNGLGNELKSVKNLLDGLEGQADSANSLVQGLAQAAGNSGLRGQSAQVGMPGFTTITSQLGDQAWGDELVSKVKWQVGQEIQEAKIHLNPRELGPLQVKINISDDQATVQFVAQHSMVRDAIEDAMPRLREMLEQSGLNLADANVSQGDHQAFSGETGQRAENNSDNDDVESGEGLTGPVVKKGEGLVDAFV
jgi:flagellar hook-length control protein FliK